MPALLWNQRNSKTYVYSMARSLYDRCCTSRLETCESAETGKSMTITNHNVYSAVNSPSSSTLTLWPPSQDDVLSGSKSFSRQEKTITEVKSCEKKDSDDVSRSQTTDKQFTFIWGINTTQLLVGRHFKIYHHLRCYHHHHHQSHPHTHCTRTQGINTYN